MKMTQFAKFANNATNQILGTTGLIRENLQSMFSYPNAVDAIPVIVSGDVIHIEDAAPQNAKNVTVYIKPVQDLHGYDNPWPAGGGKNKFEVTSTSTTQNGVTITVNSDGTISLSGTATEQVIFSIGSVTLYGEYILSGCPSGGTYSTYSLYCVDYDYGSGVTVTFDGTSKNVQLYVRSGVNTNGLVFKPMIRLSSESDATFAPYSNVCPISGWTGANITVNGNTIAIPFPSEAGTVYGGTLDVTTGVLTVNRAIVDMGTLNWTYDSGYPRFYSSGLTDSIKNVSSNFDVVNAISEMYTAKSLEYIYANVRSGFMGLSVNGTLTVINTAYTNAYAFKTAMSGVHIVYELDTPVTYQLTPQQIALLRGNNTLYANCGSIELKYYRIEGSANPYV